MLQKPGWLTDSQRGGSWFLPRLKKAGGSTTSSSDDSDKSKSGNAETSTIAEADPVSEQLKATWRRLRNRARQAKIVYTAVAILLLLVLMSSILAYRAKLSRSGTEIVYETEKPSKDGASLEGEIAMVDITKHQVAVTWTFAAYGNFSLDQNIDGGPSDSFLDVDVDVYTNGRNEAVASYNTAFESEYTRQTFTTTHRTTSSKTFKAARTRASTTFYPFDTYTSNASYALIMPHSNNTVPLVSCAVMSTLQGWKVASSIYNAPYHGVSFHGPGCVLSLQLERDATSRAVALVIFLIMYVVTLLVLHLTIRTVFLHEPIQATMLNFPATILFALPALRNTLPDSPPFGTFGDVFVFLICELLTALSLVGLIVSLAVDRDKLKAQKEKRLKAALDKAKAKGTGETVNSRQVPSPSPKEEMLESGYWSYYDPEAADFGRGLFSRPSSPLPLVEKRKRSRLSRHSRV